MSVMECGKHGCTNVLCSHLLFGKSYICRECLDELNKVIEGWALPLTKEEVKQRIQDWLRLPKESYKTLKTIEDIEKFAIRNCDE